MMYSIFGNHTELRKPADTKIRNHPQFSEACNLPDELLDYNEGRSHLVRVHSASC